MYFGPSGIGYTLGRIHINSCDFSLASYSFDDVVNDFEVITIVLLLLFAFINADFYYHFCLYISLITLI
jgi:hypothetical protein